ncbi:hypothetical protein F2Q70_00016583 [Brassica cretica]|uniref:Uncharacterized protein n=1 Tax=Brassica cretica TaxID=69181 RepID=A0A8S9HXD4_BRACR|nr:hypothetical protein F2Q70_00016583 [Brassica cretica]
MATFDTFSDGNGLGMVDDGALIGGWERLNSNPKLFLLAFRLANSDQAQLRSSSTPIKLSFRSSLSVINVLSLSSAYVQLRPNPRPDATVREKKQARDSSRQRDKIGAVPRPFVSARL